MIQNNTDPGNQNDTKFNAMKVLKRYIFQEIIHSLSRLTRMIYEFNSEKSKSRSLSATFCLKYNIINSKKRQFKYDYLH